MKRDALLHWLRPEPGSIAADDLRMARSPWINVIHLAWSVWVFITPALSSGAYGYTAAGTTGVAVRALVAFAADLASGE